MKDVGMKDQDKTKQQLIEELAELRRSLDALMNNLPEGVLIVDAPDAKIRLASRDAHQMMGVAREEFEGIGGEEHFRYYQAFHPNGAPAELGQLPLARALVSGEVIRNEEWLLQVSGGRRIPIVCHAGPIRDQQGTITGGVISWQDITERKRAEEALRTAHDELERRVEERTADLTKANEELAIFQKLAEASGQGFGMGDLNGRIAYVNPALCRLMGEDRPEDVIGKSFLTYYPEGWQQRRQDEVIPALERDGHWAGEQALLSRQGRLIPTLHDAFLLRDEQGLPVQRAIVVTDITERKRAEEALRQSEGRFRNYFEQGLIGMAVTSLDKRWLEVNDRLCEILGYSRQELLRSTWADLTCPDDLEPNLSLYQRLLSGEIEHYTMDKRFFRKDGSIVCTTIHIRAFRKDDGSIDHCVSLTEDITARKQAEEAVERERQSLWRMLQASDYERRLIAYDIHDGLAQYLAAAVMQFQSHDALQANSPDQAQKAYQTAVELVRQAHAESRRLISEVRPPVIDEDGLETAISHLVHEQRRRGGPKIELHSSVQFGRLPSILENALYRIAQEALTNACKHSNSKTVTVTMGQEGQEVQLEVRDWGIGFDPATVEKGHFGLEGIRQRVRLLGGRHTIESQPGAGTLVQVVVPVVEKQNEG